MCGFFMSCSISACVSAGPRMATCIWDTAEGPLLRGVTNDGRISDRLIPRVLFALCTWQAEGTLSAYVDASVRARARVGDYTNHTPPQVSEDASNRDGRTQSPVSRNQRISSGHLEVKATGPPAHCTIRAARLWYPNKTSTTPIRL
jgi:hypothetical protein